MGIFVFRALFALFFVSFTLRAEEIALTILASADLHGDAAVIRGPLREAVGREFAAAPGRVLYVDAGDTIQGTFAAWQSCGQGIMSELGRTGCAVWVPGNHDIEFGWNAFASAVREFPGAVLAANLHAPELADKVVPYRIFTLKGVRIAVIGTMLPRMNNCFPIPEERFETLPSPESLRRALAEVHAARVDLVVVVRHSGIYSAGENLYSMMKELPGVDLVIGAHTHKAESGRRIAGAWYVQPPPHGEGIVKVSAFLDAPTHRLNRLESEIVPLVRPRTVRDPVLRHTVTKNLPARVWAAESMRKSVKADVAICALPSEKSAARLDAAAPLTVNDCYSVFRYCDRVVTVDLTREELRTVVAEYGDFAHKRKMLLTMAGGSFAMKRKQLTEFRLDAEKALYRTALSSYAAAGAGGSLPRTRAIVRGRIDHGAAENAVPLLRVLCGDAL